MTKDGEETARAMILMYQQGFLDGAMMNNPRKDPVKFWQKIKKHALREWERKFKKLDLDSVAKEEGDKNGNC